MMHNLKIYPEHFLKVLTGAKRAEVRINDRDYQKGDILVLREWDISYSGRRMTRIVTDVTDISFIADGYVLLSMEPYKIR